jgi:hypothetical protein
MSTFTKLPSGKVLFIQGDTIAALSPNMNLFQHPSQPNGIIITDDSNPQELDKCFKVDWSQVTEPVAESREEMIMVLATDFFF